jgi:hypothetical protein
MILDTQHYEIVLDVIHHGTSVDHFVFMIVVLRQERGKVLVLEVTVYAGIKTHTPKIKCVLGF